MAVKVSDPEGRKWVVRRQWAPRLEGRGLRARLRRGRARRKESGRWSDWLDLPVDLPDSLTVLLVVVALVAAAVFLIFVGFPLLLALLDLIVVIALVVGGVVGRVAFRRPWTIEAMAEDGRRWSAEAVGWKASGQRRQDMADHLAARRRPEEMTGPAANW